MKLWSNIGSPEKVEWSGEAFKKMKNLRVISFRHLQFCQGSKCLPNSLRVLEWHDYPSATLPNDFDPLKNFYNLRILNLRKSKNLKELPDISRAANLEELNVNCCKELRKIDDSVGHLTKLRELYADGCTMLDTFIVGGIKLVSLEILNLARCMKLHTFPEVFVTMKRTKTLDLSYTAIKTLPKSIEKLVALEALYLTGCSELRQLPNLACCNLKTLTLNDCKHLQEFRGIPPNIEVFSISGRTSWTSCFTKLLLTKDFYYLRKLILRGSENLKEIPDISRATNLEELDVYYCKKLTKIDDSVGHLAKLKVLNAERCEKLDTFIIGGIKLVSLEILGLIYCDELHTFPEVLVTMKKIKTLDLSYTAIKKLPESIEKLVALEALHLRYCRELHQLPNLTWRHLKTLDLDGCKNLQEIRGTLPNLEVFSVYNCTSLASCFTRLLLTQQFYNLHELVLRGLNLEEVPNISGAMNLEKLNVSYCKKLTKIDDSIGHLVKLRVLDAERCERLDTFIVGGIKLVSLEVLNLSYCGKLHTFLEILVTMKKIELLDLSHTIIETLPESIEKLVALETLYMSWCEGLRELPSLTCCKLKTLRLDQCKQLQEIRGIPPNMEVLCALNCTSLSSRSTRRLLAQGLQETGKSEFILPGKEIPNWLHKYSTGSSVSFWVHTEFPQIALCAALPGGPFNVGLSRFRMRINGRNGVVLRHLTKPYIETDHILLFDININIIRDHLAEELNHVEVSWEGLDRPHKWFGVYVYNYDSCMEDILFENPIPQKRIPVDVVHEICDSDLESSIVNGKDRKANNEEGPSIEVGSSIKEKEINLKVDAVDRSSFSTLRGLSSDTNGSLEDQSTINDKGHDEMGSHKTRATCFDLFCCLCSSSAAP